MEPSRDQVAGGLHFLQLAAAATAEEEGKPTEADQATGEHGLQQAAASIHTAFREVQLLSHLLELTAQPKPSAGTTAFQISAVNDPGESTTSKDIAFLAHRRSSAAELRSAAADLRAAAAAHERATQGAQEWAAGAAKLGQGHAMMSKADIRELLTLMHDEGVDGHAAERHSRLLQLPWRPGMHSTAVATPELRTATALRLQSRAADSAGSGVPLDPFLPDPGAALKHPLLLPLGMQHEEDRHQARRQRMPVHQHVHRTDSVTSGPAPGGAGLFLLPALPLPPQAPGTSSWRPGCMASPEAVHSALRCVAAMLDGDNVLESALAVGVRGGRQAVVRAEEEYARTLGQDTASEAGQLLWPVLAVCRLEVGAPAPSWAAHCPAQRSGATVDGGVSLAHLRLAKALVQLVQAGAGGDMHPSLLATAQEVSLPPPPPVVSLACQAWSVQGQAAALWQVRLYAGHEAAQAAAREEGELSEEALKELVASHCQDGAGGVSVADLVQSIL